MLEIPIEKSYLVIITQSSSTQRTQNLPETKASLDQFQFCLIGNHLMYCIDIQYGHYVNRIDLFAYVLDAKTRQEIIHKIIYRRTECNLTTQSMCMHISNMT